jgi:hypothetical protein
VSAAAIHADFWAGRSNARNAWFCGFNVGLIEKQRAILEAADA